MKHYFLYVVILCTVYSLKAQNEDPLLRIEYKNTIFDTVAYDQSMEYLQQAEKEALKDPASAMFPPATSLKAQIGREASIEKRAIYIMDSLLFIKDLNPDAFSSEATYFVDAARERTASVKSHHEDLQSLSWRPIRFRPASDIQITPLKNDQKVIGGYSTYKVIVTLSDPYTLNGTSIGKYDTSNITIEMYVTEALSELKLHPAIRYPLDFSEYFPLKITITDKNKAGTRIESNLIPEGE